MISHLSELLGPDWQKKVLIFFAALCASGGFYSAGVLYKVPSGLIELGGAQIVERTLVDAALQLTLATIFGRLIVLFGFPIFFEISRVAVQGFLQLRRIFGQKRILRLAVKMLARLDQAYVIVVGYVTQASFLCTILVFAYLSAGGFRAAFALIFVACMPLYLHLFNDFVRERRFRIRFRRRYDRIGHHSIWQFSAISAFLVFCFMAGTSRLLSIIDSDDFTFSSDWEGGYVLIAQSDFGFILVKRTETQDAVSREWLVVSPPTSIRLEEITPRSQ